MLSPATHHSPSRRRFGLTEILLIAGILVFGAFTFAGDDRHNFGSLLSGYEDANGE